MAEPERSSWKTTTVVFLSMFLLLLVFQSNRVTLTQDEGLTLDPAQRMASGELVYVDFFGYMTPGSYWLQDLMFRLFGFTLWAGRLMVMLDFSVQCALLFWLTARLASSKVAVAVLLAFAGFQISTASFLTAAHRWDSGTLALAGLCLAVHCVHREVTRGTPWIWGASGALLAAAAWCTPSLAVVIAVEGVWLLAAPARRKAAVPFMFGVMGVTALAVAGLAAIGSLSAFVQQLVWLRQNYAGINVMPYGSMNGGYYSLLKGADGLAGWIVSLAMIVCIALPAILPPIALVAWIAALWRGKVSLRERPELLLLLLRHGQFDDPGVSARQHDSFGLRCDFAVRTRGGSTGAYRRPLKSVRLWRSRRLRLRRSSPRITLSHGMGQVRFRPPWGACASRTRNLPIFEKLFQEVRPGDGLFVYPYMPIHYFLTQGRNPARFSFLQPGMMTG